MLVSVKERLLLMNMLPVEGDLAELRMIRQLQDDLGFIEAEKAKLNFSVKDNQITWAAEHDTPIDVALSKERRELLDRAFLKLDADKRLTMAHLDLHERLAEAAVAAFPREA